MQLNNKTALVIGGGQTPGATIGNGRAVSLAFANAGASVVVADRNLQSAEDTVTAITDAGGKPSPFRSTFETRIKSKRRSAPPVSTLADSISCTTTWASPQARASRCPR